MQRLPNLLTPPAVIALPLSGRAAAGLMLALIGGSDGACDPQRLAKALAFDPSLALWTACRAALRLPDAPRTIDDLADWLAAHALAELSGLGRDSPVPAACADLAASSLVVAQLAEQIAQAHDLDGAASYLAGLLYLAPQWLAEFTSEGCEACAGDILPHWLRDSLAQIATAPTSPLTSAANCVALAVRLVTAPGDVDRTAADFPCDFEECRSRLSAARQEWFEPGEPDALPSLLVKLERLEQLTRRFDQTLEAEKLESLKELAYGAGHEINNPLANISARAQTLLPDERDPERRRLLAAIQTQAMRAHEMIADMMLFARPPRPKFEEIDLTALLRALTQELAPQAEQARCELTFVGPTSPVIVSADRTQIATAIRAVCVNALEALVTGGRVVISTAESAPLDNTVQIAVSDNGPGISVETRRHVFDPFFSGREAGRGLGFGLSKCWRIVTLHGGRIDVETEAAGGARFTISLPKRQLP